jgi:hypothetical protein
VHLAVARPVNSSKVYAALRIATIAADKEKGNPPLIAVAMVGESKAGAAAKT